MEAESLNTVAVTEQVDFTALLEQSDAPQSEIVGGSHRNLELGRKMAAVGPIPIKELIDLIPECSERPDNMMLNKQGLQCHTKKLKGLSRPVVLALAPADTLQNISTFWETKRVDFFGDNGILFEHIADERTKKHAIADFCLTSSYAEQMCANQYRDFAFSISLTDETARLLRWDCSGVIFSEDIHYRNNPKPRCRFLWRFENADSSQRGADTSVHKRTTEAEESLFRDTVKAHVKLQLGLTDENGIPHLCCTILRIIPSTLEHLLGDGTQV
ncbi:hypothetical protein EDD18DRAFT_1395716 [Armillaria luteobubalina]|uniref:Fungal-type protein kinase domain-containing protein n=1 Tax=Armillaria luteobubalina TaxID=153913 RepID=A0AA39URZ5_9AGAR|nr:hypothetical protein EDD18DRAFT_1395716 [Armillaria luteobubalina]